MSSDAADDPAARRLLLIARSAELRVALAHDARAFRTPLAVADQVVFGARWLARHPGWPVAGMLLLVAVRPRRVIGWGSRLWWAWSAWRRVQRWLSAQPQ